jgi:hypothetical protein
MAYDVGEALDLLVRLAQVRRSLSNPGLQAGIGPLQGRVRGFEGSRRAPREKNGEPGEGNDEERAEKRDEQKLSAGALELVGPHPQEPLLFGFHMLDPSLDIIHQVAPAVAPHDSKRAGGIPSLIQSNGLGEVIELAADYRLEGVESRPLRRVVGGCCLELRERPRNIDSGSAVARQISRIAARQEIPALRGLCPSQDQLELRKPVLHLQRVRCSFSLNLCALRHPRRSRNYDQKDSKADSKEQRLMLWA